MNETTPHTPLVSAKAGTQSGQEILDSRVRGNERVEGAATRTKRAIASVHDHASALTLALRLASDLMRLHALCGASTCRRARACRGEPRDCLARCAPLVPQDARDGAKAMFDGWWRGLPFDDLLDEAEEELEALDAWQQAIERSYPRSSR